MSLFQLVLTVVLLTAPPDKVEMADQVAVHRLVAAQMTAVAMEWEILDPRETEFLKNGQDFQSDLKLLQGRYAELHGAPMAAEAERFQGRELINSLLTFNRSYYESIDSRLKLDMVHSEELTAILLETDQIAKVYHAVLDARNDFYYVTFRRQALAQLRDLVGLEGFYTGQLPPHVPLWRIPEEK